MEMKDVKPNEVDLVLDMYQTYRLKYGLCSVREFCNYYLHRCECCGTIEYIERCKNILNWDGYMEKVCANCFEQIQNDNEEHIQDVWDEVDNYVDDLRLGMIK